MAVPGVQMINTFEKDGSETPQLKKTELIIEMLGILIEEFNCNHQ
jgi:hypothetical protein